MTDFLDGIFISEMLVDNPSGGGSGTDTDGDGASSKGDEYVELQNATGSTKLLDGYELWSEDRGKLYEFSPGDTIEPGQTATVVGEYTGALPDDYYDAGNSDGTNFLADGEGTRNDSIFLVNSDTGEYVVFSYGQPPVAPILPPGFPGTTQVGAGETLNSGGPNNTAFVRDASGNFAEGTPNPGTPGPVCYTPGTLILTMRGEVAVEHLRIGDRLITADHGARKILRVIRTWHSFRDGPHKHKPIEIKSGSLGPGLPRQTLVVSPQHRILLQGTAVETMFGAREVLALAKGLVGLDHVRVMSGKRSVTYYSLLCERHEVILANGAWSESFYVGPTALSMLHRRSRADLEDLFPAVREDPISGYGPVARQVLTRAETEALVAVLSSSNDPGPGDSKATKWTDEAEFNAWDDDLACEERSARRAARPKLKLVT